MVSNYLANWLGFIFSSLPNVVTGGHRQQSFSARCYEAFVVEGKRGWKIPMRVVDFLIGDGTGSDEDHCFKAYRKEQRAGFPKTYG